MADAGVAPMRRLFFALWPDDATRKAIAKALRGLPQCGGRPLRAENLHLTLIFIGPADEATYGCLTRRAAEVTGAAFTLKLDRLGYFSRPHILWLGPPACPPELVALVDALAERFATCGYRLPPRPFHPHVTLLRKAVPAAEEISIEPVEWRVDAFCLVESVTHPGGVRYGILHRYALRQ